MGNVTAAVILAILAICFTRYTFINATSDIVIQSFKTTFAKIAGAAALTNDEKLLFSEEAYLPFHLIVMSRFKERARLGRHCPVSISFQFKGRV